jgi:hypothetical protein
MLITFAIKYDARHQYSTQPTLDRACARLLRQP